MLLWILDFEDGDEKYGIGDWFWDPWIRKIMVHYAIIPGFWIMVE
jgi:hypothetical protein